MVSNQLLHLYLFRKNKIMLKNLLQYHFISKQIRISLNFGIKQELKIFINYQIDEFKSPSKIYELNTTQPPIIGCTGCFIVIK